MSPLSKMDDGINNLNVTDVPIFFIASFHALLPEPQWTCHSPFAAIVVNQNIKERIIKSRKNKVKKNDLIWILNCLKGCEQICQNLLVSTWFFIRYSSAIRWFRVISFIFVCFRCLGCFLSIFQLSHKYLLNNVIFYQTHHENRRPVLMYIREPLQLMICL